MKVLIIDDEAPARRGLREILGKLGVSDVRDAGTHRGFHQRTRHTAAT